MSDNQLSSDILESQFGPTQLQIITHKHLERVICTTDANSQRLELSHVKFRPNIETDFDAIYQKMESGVSMGKAFRNAEVDFTRQDQLVARVALTPELEKWFGVQGKATIVQTNISVGKAKIHVADIFEIYSPLVKWPHAKRDTLNELELSQLKFLSETARKYSLPSTKEK